MIKKAGVTYDAAEVHAVVSELPGVRKGCVAAFSVPNESRGTEEFVVVAEVRPGMLDLPTVELSIRREVQRSVFARAERVDEPGRQGPVLQQGPRG